MIHKSNQQPNPYYNILPKPRPLHHKSPIVINSIFQYPPHQILEYSQKSQANQHISQLNISNQLNSTLKKQVLNNKNEIHEIGEYFQNLFRNPIYRMHEYLKEDKNNQQYGSCKINISDDSKIRIYSQSNQLSTNILQFQSCFQSGNLAYAAVDQKDSKNYFLFLHKDINSKINSTTQWFYFSVKNHTNLGYYTFNIVNYSKGSSAFQWGMKPCVLSKKAKKYWVREGLNIKYRKNSIKRSNGKNFYSFSFTYEFTAKDDQVYFAYCYPYTYTRLMNLLTKMEHMHGDLMHRRVIAHTLGGNPVEMLTITNRNPNDNKKVIVISSRVHSGQTVSSYICQGIITHLLGNSEDAKSLRNQYIIKIFPMLNPDGVINGHYRTSLSGDDLNRNWKNPDKKNHPQIYYVKKAISQTPYQKSIYIDLHGHSRKKSSFMYGCQDSHNPYFCRQFPYLMSKKGYQFNFYSCNFTTPKHREGTSRIVVWKQMDIQHSYTMQASFCSAVKKDIHFQIKDYLEMGIKLCQSMYLYFCKKNECQEVEEIISNLYLQKQLLGVGKEDSNGSSSDNEEDFNQIIDKKISPPKIAVLQMTFNSNKKWFNIKKHSFLKPRNLVQSPYKQRGYDKSIKIPVTQLELVTCNALGPSQSLSLRKQGCQTVYQSAFLKDKYIHSNLNLTVKSPNIFLETTTNYPQLIIPKVMRNDYKKYQRYRRQQYQIRVSQIYGEKNCYRSNQFISNGKLINSIRDNNLLQSIRNKKQLRSVEKRVNKNMSKLIKYS